MMPKIFKGGFISPVKKIYDLNNLTEIELLHDFRELFFLLLGFLCAVAGTGLHTLGYACRIERPTDDVITNAGQILNSSATNEDRRVLLQIVTFTGNVYGTFLLVGEAHPCNLSYSRVRLFGSGRGNRKAHTSLLRAVVQNGRLALVNLLFSAVSDKLVDCRHFISSLFYSGKIPVEYITPCRIPLKRRRNSEFRH